MKRKEILDAALQCVCGDREQDYGHPENSFSAIAALWEVYIQEKCLGTPAKLDILPEDVAVMMALFKIARIAVGRFKEDSYIDACGYMACAGEIAGGEEK